MNNERDWHQAQMGPADMYSAAATLEESEQKTREFRLFTDGKEPRIDALAIMAQLLQELQENERTAALGYFADLYGYRLAPKMRV